MKILTKEQAGNIIDIDAERINALFMLDAVREWDNQIGATCYYPLFLQVYADKKWQEMLAKN